MGFSEGIKLSAGWNGTFGFVLEGQVTYAVQRDAWSQEGWRVDPDVRAWYHKNRGGMPRHPMALSIDDLVRHAVFEPEDRKG